ncbi:response regulator [Kitasatospora kifunensis]|uniref:DNA-binding NarL/FixJ family response regulator n=1 Tax=Kitasatospora kifunensis TaxID=58351 RepID=A0A7W7R6Y9_KITKI|nr:response regulator transcription factor [Kitasatospora kifunensis]MBB4926567.1 DNA-binding NarL/FixJ family response regulator [Kitasatospora kifunensis]
MTRVLVVDDQMLIRVGLAALLRAAPGMQVVGEAADGEQALALAVAERPDIVLMDIRMPGMDGITATDRILNEAPEPKPRIIILTTFDLDEYVYSALRAGAAGFLLKDTPPERLLTAVATVAAGDMLFAPSVVCRLIEAYAHRAAGRVADPPPGLDPLTSRELDVLRLVGQGLSNPEIAGRLVVSVATVKTHLNRTMAKLNLSSRAQAVVLAYESGLVIPGGAG